MNKKKIDKPAVSKGLSAPNWVQTERDTHISWANLIGREPKAAMIAHHLVAIANKENAVVISQGNLAEVCGVSLNTLKRGLDVLKNENWIQVVSLSGGMSVKAYVLNSRVSWSDKRENLPTAIFTATVYTREADQSESDRVNSKDLRKIPLITDMA